MVVPDIDLKTLIKIVHLAGLAVGLGGALLLDLIALRFLVLQQISEDIYRIFSFSTRIVFWGLIALWISGFAYLAYYAVYDPHSLSNPKVWAKMMIVVILSVNGWWIHRQILPLIHKNIGTHLFSKLTLPQRRLMLSSSVISLCSWLVPLVLGACKELNFCISAKIILLIYSGLVGVGLSFAWVLSKHTHRLYEPDSDKSQSHVAP